MPIKRCGCRLFMRSGARHVFKALQLGRLPDPQYHVALSLGVCSRGRFSSKQIACKQTAYALGSGCNISKDVRAFSAGPAETSISNVNDDTATLEKPGAGNRVILVDGHAMLFRFHFAYGGVLTSSTGENTSIAYGFVKQIVRLLTDIDPPATHMVVVFDAPGKTFRHELFPGYKDQRPPMPQEIKDATPTVLSILQLLKIPVVRIHGVEADDVIGTLAERIAAEGSYAMIVSPDRDFYQLLRRGVFLLRAIKWTEGNKDLETAAGLRVYSPDHFEEEFGISPEQWPAMRALSGDKSDNLPGVPGIGEKGALTLIKEYGSLRNLLENASQVKRKSYREQLSSEDGQAMALLGLELITIQTDMDLPPLRVPLSDFELQDLTMHERSALLKKFEELQFEHTARQVKALWKENDLHRNSYEHQTQ